MITPRSRAIVPVGGSPRPCDGPGSPRAHGGRHVRRPPRRAGAACRFPYLLVRRGRCTRRTDDEPEEEDGVPRTDLRRPAGVGGRDATTSATAGYEKYAEFANAARAAGVLVGGDELASTRSATTVRVRDGKQLVSDGPYAEVKEALGGYFILDCPSFDDALDWAARIPAVDTAPSRSVPSTSTRRPDMQYALLVYSDQSSWDGIDEEEAARRRAESMPRWVTLFEEMGKADPNAEGRELVGGKRREGRSDRRRRARRHRRPVRGDEGADRRTLPHRRSPTSTRRSASRRSCRLRTTARWRSGLSWSGDRLARGDVPRRVAACGRDPHPRPRRPLARRGRGAGRVRDRPRAVAARRRAAVARRLDRRDRAERCDRPDPPRADLRAQGRAARAAPGAARRGGRRRELDPRRAARARSSRAATRRSRSRRGSRSRCARSRASRRPRSPARSSSPSRRSRNASCARSGASATRGSRSASRPTTCSPTALPDVLRVLYLVFNEGYAASAGDALVRRELCAEAIRLAKLLCVLMPDEPEAFGLLALLLLQDSRRDARIGVDGELVLLADQDRRAVGPRRRSTRASACSPGRGDAASGAVPAPGGDRRRPRQRTRSRR